ncbi:MAG: agmatine deiminase family protein [Bacteroidetes bacterium]|nr:agmatine deiminase family protein [Bacteroidota bacterium]
MPQKVTDENDQPFTIIALPVPAMRFHMKEDSVPDITVDTVRFQGFENGAIIYQAPIVSYLNFFICNNTVIVPEYYNDRLTDAEKLKDENVGKIFGELFPDKKIVRLNPLPLNFAGGGIRRSFISEPKGIVTPKSPVK